jgi:hypothetical protein
MWPPSPNQLAASSWQQVGFGSEAYRWCLFSARPDLLSAAITRQAHAELRQAMQLVKIRQRKPLLF